MPCLVIAVNLIGEVCQALFIDGVINQDTSGFKLQYLHETISG